MCLNLDKPNNKNPVINPIKAREFPIILLEGFHRSQESWCSSSSSSPCLSGETLVYGPG